MGSPAFRGDGNTDLRDTPVRYDAAEQQAADHRRKLRREDQSDLGRRSAEVKYRKGSATRGIPSPRNEIACPANSRRKFG